MSSSDPFQTPRAASPQPTSAPSYSYAQHPFSHQPPPSRRPGWKPVILSGLAGAVAGAVLSAGVAVPLTMVLTDDEPVISSTDRGAGTGDSDQGGTGTELPDGGFGAGGGIQGIPSSLTGVEASEEQSAGVVLVESLMRGGAGAGTGMVLTSGGLVLTNYHVVEDSTEVQVSVAVDGTTYGAELVGADETADVALLQLEDASGLDTVALDDDGDAVVGAGVTAIGNAQGQGFLSAMTGSVTALEQQITTSDKMGFGATDAELTGLLQTDAAVVSGYSGGPMLDDQGEVVGISTAASMNAAQNRGGQNGGAQNRGAQSYAVPIEDALAIVDRIEDGDESGTVRIGPGAYLGIGAQTTADGVGVAEVETGSATDDVGLVVGDVITALDGSALTSLSDLTARLATYEPGEQVELTWTTRAGETRAATVTLGESPVN
ncbi:S1C family serine protease [Nocardioides pacificus]